MHTLSNWAARYLESWSIRGTTHTKRSGDEWILWFIYQVRFWWDPSPSLLSRCLSSGWAQRGRAKTNLRTYPREMEREDPGRVSDGRIQWSCQGKDCSSLSVRLQELPMLFPGSSLLSSGLSLCLDFQASPALPIVQPCSFCFSYLLFYPVAFHLSKSCVTLKPVQVSLSSS